MREPGDVPLMALIRHPAINLSLKCQHGCQRKLIMSLLCANILIGDEKSTGRDLFNFDRQLE